MILIEYIILLFPTLFEVVTDYYQIKRGKEKHTQDVYIRVALCLLAALTCMWLYEKEWYQGFIYSGCLFFLLFDYVLNVVRELPIQHKGNSKVDKFLYQFPFLIEIFIKLFFFSVGYGFYYHLDLIL